MIKKNNRTKQKLVVIIIFSQNLSCQCPSLLSDSESIPAFPSSLPALSLDLLWALWSKLRLRLRTE